MPTRLSVHSDDHEWTAIVDGHTVTLDDAGEPIIVTDAGDGRFRLDGASTRSGVAAEAGGVIWVSIDGDVFAFRVGASGRRGPSSARDQDALSAPMPATVVRILVAAGDTVRQGDTLVALEAMKMELPIRAPRDGIIRAIHCEEGQLVQPGNALVEMERARDRVRSEGRGRSGVKGTGGPE